MSVEKLIVTKEDTGFTMLSNHVLQNLNNAEALGLWVYLASLPPSWEFYKQKIRDHFKFGREKLDRLFKYLSDCGLLDLCIVRNIKGQFAHLNVHVKNGSSFKINNMDGVQSPVTEKPLTANRLPVNSTYKDIDINTQSHKDKKKLLSASDDAQDRFEEFWKSYPQKKNKVRSKKIWDKKKLSEEKVNKIINDINNRSKNDIQWKNKQYIPHPATYLNNELWNDEITTSNVTPIKQNNKAVETRSTVMEWGPGHPDWERNHRA